MVVDHPSETSTFLFTDIEGSTRLWERHPDAMKAALARHDYILQTAIEENRGSVFKTVGDAFYGVFSNATDAVAAAIAIQADLQAESWGDVGEIKVRVAVHTGEAEHRAGDYFGPALNCVARMLSAGHGQQVLLSSETAEKVRAFLPEETGLRDMGERRLQDIHSPVRIFQLQIAGLPDAFPPLRTLDQRPNNLPAQLTPLIGREREVEEARRQLQREYCRLLTLTGPGGIGKTRLSLKIAAELLDDCPDGVFFVALAPVRDAGLVLSTIAETLGVREVGGEQLLDTLKAYLRDKQLLLVLDNFEHVMSAATVVGELLEAAPLLKILVTSRRLLRLYGEQSFPVPPLGLPGRRRMPTLESLTHYDAIRLFVERAMALKPDFQLTSDNASSVVEICHRLDGLPLAIELAAARIRTLLPQAMLARLESRLKLLTRGARNLPRRQQTLRSTIEWSYELLSAEEQRLLQRLSVFVGGFTLEAAEAVCDGSGDLALDVLDGVESLVDNSLVYRDEVSEQEMRFAMLETIREYGQERLQESGEAGSCRSRHVGFFLELAESAEPELTGAQQAGWLKRLETDHDNLRQALGWTFDHEDADLALRISGALHRFWSLRGHLTEGRGWLERALSLGGSEPSTARARALRGAGNLAWRLADLASARQFHEESLTISRQIGDRWAIAASLNNLANVAGYQGEGARARSLLEESLAIYRELNDRTNIAVTLTNLGVVAENDEEYDQARSLYEESLPICRELGDSARVALNLYNLGVVATWQGDYALAQSHCEESLSISRELGDDGNVAFALGQLAEIAIHKGDSHLAGSYLRENLTIQSEVGDKRGVVQALCRVASLAAAQGEPERAARLLGVAQAQQSATGISSAPAERAECDRVAETVRDILGEEEFSAASAIGGSMTLEQAVAYALEGIPAP